MSFIKKLLLGCGCLSVLAVLTMMVFIALTAGNSKNSAEPPPRAPGYQDEDGGAGSGATPGRTSGNPNVPPNKQGYSPSCGEKIVKFARQQVARGLTYVFGGCNAARGEFDCSGLVLASCSEVGISGPRTADVQANPAKWSGGSGSAYWLIGPIGIEPEPLIQNGRCPTGRDYRNLGPKPFDQSKLKPGDLLFYGNQDPTKNGTKYQGCNGVRHVAIYAGDGKMIHAPGSGRQLEEVSVRTSGFYGAVRVCNDGGSGPAPTTTTGAGELDIDRSRIFAGAKLDLYKRHITAYAKRHYSLNTWQLTPRWIVLHTTETAGFPNGFLSAHQTSLEGERPGAVAQYVLEGETLYQLLPDGVMSRSAFGLNHSSYNLEIVGYASQTLPDRAITKAAQWAMYIAKKTGVPVSNVISHEEINDASYGRGNPALISDYKDEPYGGLGSAFQKVRTDPGRANMERIRTEIGRLQRNTGQ